MLHEVLYPWQENSTRLADVLASSLERMKIFWLKRCTNTGKICLGTCSLVAWDDQPFVNCVFDIQRPAASFAFLYLAKIVYKPTATAAQDGTLRQPNAGGGIIRVKISLFSYSIDGGNRNLVQRIPILTHRTTRVKTVITITTWRRWQWWAYNKQYVWLSSSIKEVRLIDAIEQIVVNQWIETSV